MKKKLRWVENTHHLIWQSLVGEYNVHIDENRVRMNMCRHNALHALFWVLLTPKEQLMELRQLYNTILSDTAKQLFDELLSLWDNIYIDKAVKWKKKKNNQ